MMVEADAGIDASLHLPWATAPTGQGHNQCEWCGRAIYLPALPCSIEPVEGLLRMKTMPGQGARCQYELGTRNPDLMREFEAEQLKRLSM